MSKKLKRKVTKEQRRHIDLIVIHCTASPDYDLGHPSFDRIGAKQIREYHMRSIDQGGKNYDDIGYHYVVRRTGIVEKGRSESVIGAHVFGHNATSIGIAYVGSCAPTIAQIEAIRKLVRELMSKYGLTKKSAVVGHRDLNPNKLCPGFDVKELITWDFK